MNEDSIKDKRGFPAVVFAAGAFAVGFILFLLMQKSFFRPDNVPIEFRYDISSLARIEPEQILYEQAGQTIQTGMDSSAAIDAEGSSLYVVGDRAVAIFSAAGEKLKQIELPDEPTCIDAAGDLIYVGFMDHIEVYSAAGEMLKKWESPFEKAYITAIAAAGNNIFAADAVNKVVWHYGKDGTLIKAIGRRDPARNIPGFVIPSPHFDLLIAGDGLLRVVDPGRHRIDAFTFDGDLEWSWGKASVGLEGFSGCCNPVAIALLPDGKFVTCEKGLVRVKIYDSDGNYIGAVAGPEQLDWNEPLQVCETPEQCEKKVLDAAADADGRVYVLDQRTNTVRIFTKKAPALEVQ